MYKELIISVSVIVIIVASNFYFGKSINNKLNHIKDSLSEMRVAIQEKNYEKADNVSKEIYGYWKNSEQFLSCYIEHDELEKVETEFTSLRACLEIREEDCLEYIDRMSFVINHIEEKDDLVWENIF